jgi:hypothetical protein
MTEGYRVESQPCYCVKNEIVVANYHNINLVQCLPINERDWYKGEYVVGFWKVKKMKV